MAIGDDTLKAQVLAIADIAKACPENLQETCFALLLKDLLDARAVGTSGTPPADAGGAAGAAPPIVDYREAPALPADTSSDITATDLHVKAKHFMNKHGLKYEDINQILYKEKDEFLPLYEDLKTTRMSESQIRLALLEALAAGLRTGEFSFSGETVREACNVRKCYDPSNFTANFKNNASLFEAFEGYSKSKPTIKLSEDGRAELVAVIRELL